MNLKNRFGNVETDDPDGLHDWLRLNRRGLFSGVNAPGVFTSDVRIAAQSCGPISPCRHVKAKGGKKARGSAKPKSPGY